MYIQIKNPLFLFFSLLICAISLSCALEGGPGRFAEEPFGNNGMKKGPRTLENIHANMNLIKPRLYYLYSQQLPRKPELAGTILLYMDVESNGAISNVSVHQSSMNDPLFEDLLEGVLSETKFDVWKKGKEKTVIMYPVEFKKENADAAPRSHARKNWEKEQKEKSKSETTQPQSDTASVKILENR
jgi:hypothetical protein